MPTRQQQRTTAILLFLTCLTGLVVYAFQGLILEINLDLYNVSRFSPTILREPISYAASPGYMALMLVGFILPITLIYVAAAYTMQVFIAPEWILLRQIGGTIHQIYLVMSLALGVSSTYIQLFSGDVEMITALLRINSVVYILWNMAIGGIALWFGIGAIFTRTVPRYMRNIMIIGGGLTVLLSILLANPTLFIYTYGLQLLPAYSAIMLLSAYLWLASETAGR